jgi:hypothetical protein
LGRVDRDRPLRGDWARIAIGPYRRWARRVAIDHHAGLIDATKYR